MTEKKGVKPKNFPWRLGILAALLVVAVGLLIADDIEKSISCQKNAKNQRRCALPVMSSPRPVTSVTAAQPNFHFVAPGVWRAAQLSPEGARRLKSYGLKSIINLRSDQERQPWEGEFAKSEAIQYYQFPLSAREVIPSKTLDAILSILNDPARQPALVHCAGGKDRTGMILAAYRIAHSGWSFKDIYQEMKMYGYENEKYPKMLETLRLWAGERGKPAMAQEIALIENAIAEQKKQPQA